MRILFISGDYPPKPGGIAVYGRSLARAVAARQEIEAVEMAAFGRWANAQDKDGQITVYRYGRPGFLGLGRLIRHRVRRFGPDLIHVLTLFPEGGWVSFLGRPYAVSLYGTEAGARGGSRITRWIKARTLAKAGLLLPISRATESRVRRDFAAGTPSRVINPGLPRKAEDDESGSVREKLGFGPENVVVLTLTRLVRRKGVDHLIESLAALPERVRLLIVGEGPDRERLERRIGDSGLGGRVVLTGFVDRTEPYFRAADIFALASFEDREKGDVEGFGIVLLEAQAHGLPVIGTDSGGIPEAFAPDETGFLVEPENPQALARAILRLAEDPGLRTEMGRKGAALVRDRFDWDDLARKVVRGYEEVLGRPGG